jgi:FkbM family methyltransferase
MVQTFWGRRLTLPAQDANTQFLYTSGALGLGENGLIRFLIRELRVDDIFYDIGANYGFYTALAQEILSEGEIHAFEPSSNVFSYLTQLKKEKTFLNEIALSDENGSKEFFDSSASNSSGKSTTSAQVAHGHQWDYTTTTVHAVTLDEYCRTHTAPTIIKIDVEGAEADVLLGGAHLLKEKAPIVAVELWSGGALSQFSLPTLAVFKKFDYTPFFIEDSGNLKITTYEYLENWLKTEHQETNLVFKPHGSTK